MKARYFAMPVRRLEVEVVARVDAALAEVAVEIADVVVLVEQLAEVAQVAAELLRRDGGVLPPFPRVAACRGRERRGAEARLADAPDQLLLLRVVEQLDRADARSRSASISFCALARRASSTRLAAELDEQPAAALGQQRDVRRDGGPSPSSASIRQVVEPLQADRLELEDLAGRDRAASIDVG